MLVRVKDGSESARTGRDVTLTVEIEFWFVRPTILNEPGGLARFRAACNRAGLREKGEYEDWHFVVKLPSTWSMDDPGHHETAGKLFDEFYGLVVSKCRTKGDMPSGCSFSCTLPAVFELVDVEVKRPRKRDESLPITICVEFFGVKPTIHQVPEDQEKFRIACRNSPPWEMKQGEKGIFVVYIPNTFDVNNAAHRESERILWQIYRAEVVDKRRTKEQMSTECVFDRCLLPAEG